MVDINYNSERTRRERCFGIEFYESMGRRKFERGADMIISEKIFMLLEKKKMSQKEFSQRTEISQSTISDWKRKKTNPSSDKILKICEVLQITPYELLAETDLKDGEKDNAVDVILNKDESLLIESFRELDVRQKSRLMGYLEGLKG